MKKNLGKKRICVCCGTKFYDLNKEPAICTNCNHIHASNEQKDDFVDHKVINDLMVARSVEKTQQLSSAEMRYIGVVDIENLDDIANDDIEMAERSFDNGDDAEYDSYINMEEGKDILNPLEDDY